MTGAEASPKAFRGSPRNTDLNAIVELTGGRRTFPDAQIRLHGLTTSEFNHSGRRAIPHPPSQLFEAPRTPRNDLMATTPRRDPEPVRRADGSASPRWTLGSRPAPVKGVELLPPIEKKKADEEDPKEAAAAKAASKTRLLAVAKRPDPPKIVTLHDTAQAEREKAAKDGAPKPPPGKTFDSLWGDATRRHDKRAKDKEAAALPPKPPKEVESIKDIEAHVRRMTEQAIGTREAKHQSLSKKYCPELRKADKMDAARQANASDRLYTKSLETSKAKMEALYHQYVESRSPRSCTMTSEDASMLGTRLYRNEPRLPE